MKLLDRLRNADSWIRMVDMISAVRDASRPHCIAIELSDLVEFLQRSRYPTGIQQVQIAIAEALAREYVGGTLREKRLYFVYFDQEKHRWVPIARGEVEQIIHLARQQGMSAGDARAFAARIKARLSKKKRFAFPSGCFLVNPGTSWGALNYPLAIRDAKRRFAIKYVPFVHDCIPIVCRKLVDRSVACAFIAWIVSLLEEADIVLAISENTKRDLQKIAADLGMALPQCRTICLNGKETVSVDDAADSAGAAKLLHDNHLDDDPFVLCVSTIEPRKNHDMLFTAWAGLLAAGKSVPRLVCAGNSGWGNDGFYQRLEADPLLRERVLVMTDVPPQMLRLLYRHCLFTVYPSLYEGWGLPISESIAYGKVPLVSNVASHTEAGGALAVYFDLNSEADLRSKLAMLIYDQQARRKLEEAIGASDTLRPWQDIAAEVILRLEGPQALQPANAVGDRESEFVHRIACGVYYKFSRNDADTLHDLLYSGDAVRRRMQWHTPEDWGCWIDGRSAEFDFLLDGNPAPKFLLYLHLNGSLHTDNNILLSLAGSASRNRFLLPKRQALWACIPLNFGPHGKRRAQLTLKIDDLAVSRRARDPRKTSIGVRGLYVCAANDVLQISAISAAMATGDLDRLARRFPPSPPAATARL